MGEEYQRKIDLLIKFLKRKPKEGNPIRIGGLLFDNEDILYKYRALDKHIKLVAECIHKGIISYDFFIEFERIRVRNYDGKLKLYVLFSNSAKYVLFSSRKHEDLEECFSSHNHRVVAESFFNKFDFIRENGLKVNINNEEIVEEEKSPRLGGRDFDLVEN